MRTTTFARRMSRTGPFLLLLALAASTALAGPAPLPLEDFEAPTVRWTFSHGPEFPGANGSFNRVAEAARTGKLGGRLAFDFSGGGSYVAAYFKMPGTPATHFNALELWLRRPDGHQLVVRYTDPAGQTFQKPVDCPAARWARVTVPFGNWTGHWGGANDGKVRGGPVALGLCMEKGENTTGALDFDDLRLVSLADTTFRASYAAYGFEPSEGWRTRSDGNAGGTSLNGKIWTLDFTQGANSLGLAVADRTLLGNVDKIRVRARGRAKGHPVELLAHTHFMTFRKVIGEFSGEGEQELVTDGPPGPGWEWHGGENDGKIHGPLRLTEIRAQANGLRDRATLELLEVRIDGSCPLDKQCLLTAEARTNEFVATLRTMTGKAPAGRVNWVLRRWNGLEVGRGGKTVANGPVPMQFAVPVPVIADAKFIEAEFTWDAPGQETAPAQAVWLPRPEDCRLATPWNPQQPGADTQLEPESPFGMGVYLGRYGGDARGLATMDRAAGMARAAGVKWSREDFSWSRLEPRRGVFDWTYYDNLVACAKRHGITVYAIAGYWSSWTKPYTEEGIQDYLRYLRAMVRHYKGDIKQWEIWNEPNIFFWQGPKEMYASLLIRSYAAIKEEDPQAQVLGLSTAGIDLEFIDKMLGLKTPFDILTIHPYRTVLKDDAFIAELKQVADKVKLPNGQSRPVWLTEMGWATFTPHNALRQDFAPTSLRAQAELIARSYLCAIVSGVEPRTFWYDFRNDGDDPVYFEHQMGVMYGDFRPKPAYQSYATLTQMLRGMKLDGPVAAPAGTFAYAFKPAQAGASLRVVAVWNPKQSIQVPVPSSARQAWLVNAVGETVRLTATNGQFTVPAPKGSPVYLVTE